MSIWDSLSQYLPYVSSSTPAPAGFLPGISQPINAPTLPAPSLYDANAMLSTHYSIKNLSPTNQSLSAPNMPKETYQFDNLFYLAEMMEILSLEVGPFQIISGFRTKELQDKLSAAGEPTSAGMSFHETGRAVDIAPTNMSLEDFFGSILANENLRKQFAEIAIKPSQNTLHLSINVPGDVRDPKITGMTAEGVYARLSLDDIASYIAPFMESVDEAYDYAAAQLVTQNRLPLILGAVAAVGGALYLALASGKSHRGSL